MDRRRLLIALGVLVLALGTVFGLTLTRQKAPRDSETKAQVAQANGQTSQEACASKATYDRLKQVVFEEAVRIRNADPANLDTLAANAVVRMENPVVKSRDEEMNVTVCTGRFVLELPPGAERAFGGERRLVANVEYSAQAAADGSGMVYQLDGAEPIVNRLASFDLQNQQVRPAAAPIQTADAGPAPVQPVREEEPEPRPAPEPRPQPAPAPRPQPKAAPAPAPTPVQTASTVRPSFNCRYARTRGEKMVCGSGSLASRDRAMSSLYFSALSQANGPAKSALRSTRNRFLAYRDRCPTEACVAEAYDGRMREIRDIMADLDN